MAPSKTTTTTKKKTVTTTTTTTSSKVKVHRSTHHNQPRPRATPLPDDWPVASIPPQFSAEQSALTPGSLLQELCSGQDIHINKQALVAPSISKEKGRYLLILPGVFSFKPIKQANSSLAAATTTTTTTTNAGTVEPTQEEPLPALTQTQDSEDVLGDANQDESDDDDDDNEPGKESTGTTTATNSSSSSNKPKSSIPQLGNLEGLATPHPKLRISFPAQRKSLVFPGTKVHSSSKYMWLNCAARKKGTVTCKVCAVVIFHDWTDSSGKVILILVCVYGVYCLGYLFVCHCVWSAPLGNRGG